MAGYSRPESFLVWEQTEESVASGQLILNFEFAKAVYCNHLLVFSTYPASRFSTGCDQTRRDSLRWKTGIIPLPAGTDLVKDGVHNSGSQQNFTVCDRHGSALSNRRIERLDEVFHARVHVKIIRQE